MFGRKTKDRAAATVVINADDAPNFFSSLNAALGHIEWQDVEDQVWGPGFDSEGRRLMLSLVWPDVGRPDVEATTDAYGPAQPEGLRTLLLSGLRGDESDASALTTDQLFAVFAGRRGVIL